jgi:DNA-binding NarL/FixJ family response regulator
MANSVGIMRSPEQPVRIVIADDHPVMREGLRCIIEQEGSMTVVAEAADGAEALAQFRLHRPDVTLIDLQMPNVDGLSAISAIRNECAEAPIVVLTTYPGDARVAQALSLGAMSYILKTSAGSDIVAAIRGALCGRKNVMGADVVRDVVSYRGTETLSEREISVLRLVAVGEQNRSIGAALNVSEETVKTRMRNILAKLDARDRTHAVTIAMRRGFIDN